MKALVITASGAPVPGHDMHGLYRRLALFMGALGSLGGRIDIAHFESEAAIAAEQDRAGRDRAQSDYWGCQVAVQPIPRRWRPATFRNHYLSGALAAAEQPSIYPFTGPAQVAAVGRLLDAAPDVVFVHRLPAMCALLRSRRRPPRVFFDLDDVEHLVRLRWCLQRPFRPGKLAYAAQVPALIAAERQGAALSRQMFVCSQTDRDHLRRLGFWRNVTVIPNAVAVPAAAPPLPAAPTLLFLGACLYEPNVVAAERLVERILPLVRRQIPAARLLIAGRDSEHLPSRRAAPPGVEYLGFVADLPALYARARVVCCPITLGGGTRVKLVEAAGYARPMVTTRIGAEGLDFADGREILLRDDDEAIAAACVRLLQDDALAARLGAAARTLMRERYEAGAIRDRLAEIFRSGPGRARGAPAYAVAAADPRGGWQPLGGP